jgi:hypothetical protein
MLLWGERDESKARQSVRRAQRQLRRSLSNAVDVTALTSCASHKPGMAHWDMGTAPVATCPTPSSHTPFIRGSRIRSARSPMSCQCALAIEPTAAAVAAARA